MILKHWTMADAPLLDIILTASLEKINN